MANAIKILVENKDRGNRGKGHTIIQLSAKVKSRLGINMTTVNNKCNQNQVREGLVHHGNAISNYQQLRQRIAATIKNAITEAKTINEFCKREFDSNSALFDIYFLLSGRYFRSF